MKSVRYSYICDQKLPCHISNNCIENGGDCSHTIRIEHAINKNHQEKMQFKTLDQQTMEEIDYAFDLD